MLALMVLSSLASVLIIFLFFPGLWSAIVAVDDALDAHEAGKAFVAARNPFRESGPPANMAKLILLRHKIQTNSRKRRSTSHARQVARTYVGPTKRSKPVWLRLGRPFGAKQYC